MNVLDTLDFLARSQVWLRSGANIREDPHSAFEFASFAPAVQEFVNNHYKAVSIKLWQIEQAELARQQALQDERERLAELAKLHTPSPLYVRGAKGLANLIYRERNQGARHRRSNTPDGWQPKLARLHQ